MKAGSQRGFTLIELVVTAAILAVLASAALPLVEVSAKRAKEQELQSALRQIREAIDAYKDASDKGRIARSVTDSGYPKRLEALVEGVPDQSLPKRPNIYFLRRLPRDPMNADASATAAATWGKRSYSSPPDDPREGEDVFDVYSLSAEPGLNGVPYRQW
jgi:general secretion pathway protein G